MFGLAGEFDPLHSWRQGQQQGSHLKAGQVGAQAEVGAVSEGQVGVGRAGDVEVERIVEHRFVTVGREVHQRHLLAGLKGGAMQLDGVLDRSRHVVDGRSPTDDLLDRGVDEARWVGAEPGPLVRVFGEEDIGGAFQVQEDGTIDFPLIGRIDVRAKTQGELANMLEQALADGYLKDPHVTVILTERENLKVSVLGQVQKPGTFAYVEKLTLVQAISEAGGLNDLAYARRVKLTRQGPTGVGTYEVSVKAITEGREVDILLQPGDIIFVPLAPL